MIKEVTQKYKNRQNIQTLKMKGLINLYFFTLTKKQQLEFHFSQENCKI